MDSKKSDTIRLNKHLALQLGVARREADQLIEQGRVLINGQVAKLGQRVVSNDAITLDGKLIGSDQEYRYILFNKPVAYVCSRKKQGDSETIYAILPADFRALKPVGRLDRNSSGLLLLTNNGDFAHQMTHPSFYKIKTYQIELDQDLAPLHQQMISDFGVRLEDGNSKLGLERTSDSHRRSWTVTMSEGRNRQIRRTFSSLGYEVVKLHRTSFGNYQLGDLKPGKYHSFQP